MVITRAASWDSPCVLQTMDEHVQMTEAVIVITFSQHHTDCILHKTQILETGMDLNGMGFSGLLLISQNV